MAECPSAALADASLPPMARVLLAVLWTHAGREGGFVWPSLDTLRARTGLKMRSVHRNLAALRDAGWVTPATDEHGRRGWDLAGASDASVRKNVSSDTSTDASVSNADASDMTPASEVTPATVKSDASVRPYSTGTNHEPTSPYSGGSTVQREPANVRAAAGLGFVDGPPGVNATHWLGEFEWEWRQSFGPVGDRPQVRNPARGARNWAGLQEALTDHGSDTVRAVLLHAGAEVQRHLESRGQANVGMHPGRLAVAFRAEAPSFGALLDDWQLAQGRKRVSGKSPAAPAELDGVPLTDEEQRVWMRAGGDQPERAVQEHRQRQAGQEFVSGLLDGAFGGAA